MRTPLLALMKTGLALAWLGALALTLATTSCSKPKESTVIKFVVPDGFRGVFQITKLEASDQAAPLQRGQVNVIKIPPSGLVQMKDMKGFVMAYKVKCETVSGQEILYSRPEAPSKGIRIFPIYSKNGEDQYYLVGTAQERDHVWANGKGFIKLGKQVLPDVPEETEGISPVEAP